MLFYLNIKFIKKFYRERKIFKKLYPCLSTYISNFDILINFICINFSAYIQLINLFQSCLHILICIVKIDMQRL